MWFTFSSVNGSPVNLELTWNWRKLERTYRGKLWRDQQAAAARYGPKQPAGLRGHRAALPRRALLETRALCNEADALHRPKPRSTSTWNLPPRSSAMYQNDGNFRQKTNQVLFMRQSQSEDYRSPDESDNSFSSDTLWLWYLDTEG